jgi:hypothetical protein
VCLLPVFPLPSGLSLPCKAGPGGGQRSVSREGRGRIHFLCLLEWDLLFTAPESLKKFIWALVLILLV